MQQNILQQQTKTKEWIDCVGVLVCFTFAINNQSRNACLTNIPCNVRLFAWFCFCFRFFFLSIYHFVVFLTRFLVCLRTHRIYRILNEFECKQNLRVSPLKLSISNAWIRSAITVASVVATSLFGAANKMRNFIYVFTAFQHMLIRD